MPYEKDILKLDAVSEIAKISDFIKEQVHLQKRDGIIIGLSGGIDSAVISALCIRALGKDKVFGLILPEKESNPISREFAQKHAEEMGIQYEIVDITPTLEAFGAYSKRDSIISGIFPSYDTSVHRIKLSLPPDVLHKESFNFFTLTIDDGKDVVWSSRLKKKVLNGIVAATDAKQRTRMMHLYYYAESMNRLVCGTTNLPETLQGFFVKCGDGGVDMEPIAHLNKSQVYMLAEELGVIQEIIDREPSPDTYNSNVGDEEFFFRMPYDHVDLLLYAWENKVPMKEVCDVMDLTEEQVGRAFRDFTSKYKATQHLRELPPSLL